MPESKSGAFTGLATSHYRESAVESGGSHSPLPLGWMTGLEPATSRATIWRSSQLNYIHHRKAIKGLARLKGLEPLAHCLEGSCSIQLSYRRIYLPARQNGAGDGNRTHASSLEGWRSTIEPHPHVRLSA